MLALTEICMKANKSFPLNWRVEGASPRQPLRGRGKGGVGLLLLGAPWYTVAYRKVTDEIQSVVIRIGDLNTGAIYVSPKAGSQEYMNILTEISTRLTGRVIIPGDFNSRNTMWDVRNNSKGILLRWASKRSWNIAGPGKANFNSKQGSSVVDLFLYRGCSVSNIQIEESGWQGCSDHMPVSATVKNSKI